MFAFSKTPPAGRSLVGEQRQPQAAAQGEPALAQGAQAAAAAAPGDPRQAAQPFQGLYDGGPRQRGATGRQASAPASAPEADRGAWDFARQWRSPEEAFAAATSSEGGDVPFRGEMERTFGQDFSGVRAHFGRRAEMAALRAHAATDGERVAFAGTAPDRKVVAHELAHVVQRRQAGGAAVQAGALSARRDPAEQEADQAADRAAAGQAAPIGARPAAGIHRDEDEEAPACEGPVVGWPGQENQNAGPHEVDSHGQIDGPGGGVRRIPLSCLSQPPATGMAVALVPPLAGVQEIDVLVHMHGHGYGYLEQPQPRDLSFSDMPQQLAASGRPTIIILPQFTSEERLDGGNHRGHTRGLDTQALIQEVFAALQAPALGVLTPEQTCGRVLISGHSAGGRTALDQAQAGGTETRGLILFDGHLESTSALREHLAAQLANDHQQLQGMTTAEGAPDAARQREFLQRGGFFFRAYGSTSCAVRNDDDGDGEEESDESCERTYQDLMEPVDEFLAEWFGDPEHTIGVAADVLPLWQSNYRRSGEDGEIADFADLRDGGSHSGIISGGGTPDDDTAYEPGTDPGSGGHLEQALEEEGSRGTIRRLAAVHRSEDPAEVEAEQAAEQACAPPTDFAEAAAHNQGLGFGPTAVQALRRGLGLSEGGQLDAGFAEALAAHQAAHGLCATGRLDQETVYTMTLLDEGVSAAASWYGSARHYQDEDQVRRVCAALGVSEGDDWQWDHGLTVQPSFVQRVAQWQLWSRLGMKLDGKLGVSGLVRLGIDPPGNDYAVWNASDLRTGEADPRLLELFTSDTVLTRCLRVLTEDGTAKRFGDITGDDGVTVGITHLTAPYQVKELLILMYQTDPQAFLANFFSDGAEHTLEEALQAVSLTETRDDATDDNADLSEIVASIHLDAFLNLFRQPQFQDVQIAYFRQHQFERGERRAGQLEGAGSTQPTLGSVALSVCAGNSSTDAFNGLSSLSGDVHERQLAVGRRYAREEPKLTDDADLSERYWEALFSHYVLGAGPLRTWSELRDELIDERGPQTEASESPYHRPERLRLVLEQFHEVWDEPYQDADTALSP